MNHPLPTPVTRACQRLACTAALLLSACLAWPAWSAAPFTVITTNGTVTDSSTGLVWDQCALGLSGANCSTGTVTPLNWAAALSAALTANTSSYKGFTDWRLPNINELESLVKLSASSPAIDVAAFPNTPQYDYFWSSTSNAPFPSYAWFVYFGNGFTDADGKTNSLVVRLVRSGQSLASFDLFPALPTQVQIATTSAAGGNVLAVVSGAGAITGCGFSTSQITSVTSSAGAATAPAGVSFPHGVFDFTTSGCTPGAVQTITITYPQALPAGAVYYKYGPTPTNAASTWYNAPFSLDSFRKVITLSITDGGVGDDDLTANGQVVDPGGVGVPAGAGAGGGAGAGAGLVSVPTLSQWGVLLLSGLMALVGGLRMRARQRALRQGR